MVAAAGRQRKRSSRKLGFGGRYPDPGAKPVAVLMVAVNLDMNFGRAFARDDLSDRTPVEY